MIEEEIHKCINENADEKKCKDCSDSKKCFEMRIDELMSTVNEFKNLNLFKNSPEYTEKCNELLDTLAAEKNN